MWTKINNTCAYLETKFSLRPKVAIILGTGLGNLASEIQIKEQLLYSEIPGFRQSTVEGHQGKLLCGTLSGVPILAMQGRLHYYEGYSMDDITFPIKVMKAFGIKTLMVSNAAGGLNPDFSSGNIMLITDHINLFPEHPLRGKNIEELGPRFPDMGNAYDKKLIKEAELIANNYHFSLKKGVYVGTQGPTFETLAEYRYFRIIGGDAVGMSTVPEVIVANHAGISCFGVSVIANIGSDANLSPVSHKEVQKNTKIAQKQLSLLFSEMVKKVSK